MLVPVGDKPLQRKDPALSRLGRERNFTRPSPFLKGLFVQAQKPSSLKQFERFAHLSLRFV